MDDLSGNGFSLYYDTIDYALATSATVSGLTVGNSYYAVVRAVNEIGESVDSNQITINAGTVPSKIKNVVLQTSTTVSFTIEWDPPVTNGGLSLTEYIVEVDIGQTGSITNTYPGLDPADNFFQISGLTTGTLVDVYVNAKNANGNGLPSDMRTFYAATAPA